MSSNQTECKDCRKLQSDILETSRQLELFVAAFKNLESQIIAFRDRAKEYQQDCERMGDADGAAENGAVRRSLDELARLAESFKPNVQGSSAQTECAALIEE